MLDQDVGTHSTELVETLARRLFASAVILIGAAVGCTRPQSNRSSAPQPQQTTFLAKGGVLYREEAGFRTPLLALDSAIAPRGAAIVPAEWTPAAGNVFRVSATQFRHIAPAPEADWVAWETAGVHDLLGVVPAAGGHITVLDFFFDSSARELSWAPAGRYLAALYSPPSGSTELRVYDTQPARRLDTPWGTECRAANGCEVTSARWTGPAIVAVKTTVREYRIDVSKL